MGKGRKPLPTALKIAKGNPGRGPLNHNEPKFSGEPVCPSWLDPKAKTEWKRIVPDLIRAGVATAADQEALIAYCEATARLQEAAKILQDEGVTVDMPVRDGVKVVKNPAGSVFNEASALVLKFSAEFGMTPSSRSKIKVEKGDSRSELEQFIGGA